MRSELELLIGEELADPELTGVRVLSISLSPGGGHARVAYVVEGELAQESERRRATLAGLTRAKGFLHARIASQLNLKRTPQLSFCFVGMTASALSAHDEGGEA